MTKLELLNAFLNDRLTAAADDIFKAIKNTVVEYQNEILRFKEENERLKKLLNVAVQRMLLHPVNNTVQPQECPDPQPCGDPLPGLGPVEPQRSAAPAPPAREIKEEEGQSPVRIDEHHTRTSLSVFSEESGHLERPHVSVDLSPIQPSYDRGPEEVKREYIPEENGNHKPGSSPTSLQPVCSNFQVGPDEPVADPTPSSVRIQNGQSSSTEKHPDSKTSGHHGDGPVLAPGLRFRAARPPRPSCQGPHLPKVHTCLECGKCFSFACQLEVHMRWHTKEKPYGCTVCRKSFTTVSMLRRHHRIHTGEKPFHCHVCGKCFNQSAHLNTHFRLHTGEGARWARMAPHS